MKNTSIYKELRSFLLLWGSQTVSELGTAMTNYALIVWVYGQRGTASSVMLLTLCAFLPTIFFRFIGGALADRWDKKRIMLLCCIRFPEAERAENAAGEPFLRSCLDGLRWLWEHKGLLQLTLFIAAVNLLAKLGDDGRLSPFVLGRTGGDERVLGFVQSAVALGLMAGSLAMTMAKSAKYKVKRVFLSTALVFVGGVVLGLTRSAAVWCAAEFASYAMAAVMNANLTAVMREQVPQGMQGRVFSAKGTLQNCTIPLGLLLGGVLADGVFEPMMASPPPVLGAVFGTGAGSGIAVLFVLTGCAGIALSLGCLRLKAARMLDK